MIVWIDADSCPRAVKEIVTKRCEKEGVRLVLAANRPLQHKLGRYVEAVTLPQHDQEVDRYIERNAEGRDIVITRDIPLAASLVDKGLTVINDRGTLYCRENVRERLSVRDWMEEYRLCGGVQRHTSFGKRELIAFANMFDRVFTWGRRNEQVSIIKRGGYSR